MLQTQALPDPAAPPAPLNPSASPEHLKDASHFAGRAEAVYFPESEEAAAWILRRARQEGRPVTLSGGGTGLTGGRVPQGGILLCTDSLNQRGRAPHESEDLAPRTALFQAGVALKEMDRALDAEGLFFPPDPGERSAFVGGTIATNASGPRSFKYGSTRRYVRRLRVVLANGDLLEIARGREKARDGRFDLRFSDGRAVAVPLPTYRTPAGIKCAAGYYVEPGMDLIDLFIGSEGTLGLVTEVELDLLPKPEAVLSGVLFFRSERDCFEFALQAKGMAPRALEFFDSRSLAILSVKHSGIPRGAGAALYFQRECAPKEETGLIQEWSRAAEKHGARASETWFSRAAEDYERLRRFRYDLPVLANELAAVRGMRKLATDLAVPADKGAEMFDCYLREIPASGIDHAIWGHLGDNHLHVNFLPKTEAQLRQAQEIYAGLARKAVELGGTVSAEHGIGKARIPYLEMMVGREGLLQMARVKKALDPEGTLNPGNIFPVELLGGSQ